MSRLLKQAQAEQDLLEIWLYTFNEWGASQADTYLDKLIEAMQLLSKQPLICRERPEFTPTVRIHHHARHLIVYLVVDEGINIVRVLHESMDVAGQLE